MIQTIRKIGNSQGILLPKNLLQQAGIEESVDVALTEEGVLLKPLKKHPRDGWDNAFKAAEEAGDEPDNDLFDGVGNKFDQEEWTW
jgi:antitoxin MazE